MLYARRHELHHADRTMFRKPLADQLKQPLSVLAIWLNVVLPAFQAAQSDDSNDLESSHDTDNPTDTSN